MSVRIITDSASDMSPAEHPALRVLPLSITFGTDVYMDGVDIDHQRFYEMLVERDELPKTGQVNPYAFSRLQLCRPCRGTCRWRRWAGSLPGLTPNGSRPFHRSRRPRTRSR